MPNLSRSILWKSVGLTTDLKTQKKVVYNKPYDLKAFVKSLGKLLMDYTSSIAHSTSNVIVRALSTIAQVLAATQYSQKLKYYL